LTLILGVKANAIFITIPYVFIDGQTLPAVKLNQNNTAITSVVNGNIDNSNISAAAAISLSKLGTGPVINSGVAGTKTWGSGITGDTEARVTQSTDGDVLFGPGGSTVPPVGIRYNNSTSVKVCDPSAPATLRGMRAGQLLGPMIAGICHGRLTPTSGTPIANAGAVNTIYFTPYKGNLIALYDGSEWTLKAFTEKSLSLAALATGLPHDIYCDAAASDVLGATAWASTTARTTAIIYQDGVPCVGVNTKRYLGTIFVRNFGGAVTDDTSLRRHIWNYAQRVPRYLFCSDGTNSATYNTAAWRVAFNDPTEGVNTFSVCTGLAEDACWIENHDFVSHTVNGTDVGVGIGIDSGTTNSASTLCAVSANTNGIPARATWNNILPIGYCIIYRLQWGNGATTTWFGDNNRSFWQTGMQALVYQ
jgi:hypothetical protein